MHPSQIYKEALWRPFALCIEPVVLYVNVYVGLAYSIFYLWFEAFPLTFQRNHGFNLGENGLAFLGKPENLLERNDELLTS
jgi:MFS transporter, DHA1 family, multidrug resistance protein